MNAVRTAAVLVAFLSSTAFALPSVSVTRFPRGMIQAIGASPATDDFALWNSGPDPASVTITQSGTFFSVSPSSFSLAVGVSRVLTITTPVLGGGMYAGTINVSVAGVPQPLIIPVRLFIGAQGQGSVNISGGGAVEVSGLPGQLHPGGFNVGNTGSTGSQGILTADVPWIDHPTSSIGIPSQSSPRISFTVDPSRRSDGVAPLGAVFGTMSFSYMTGTSNSGPATARLAVPVTDITKAVVVPQPPSALAAGETALFLPGVVNGVTDLILSNRSAERALSDLRLFYTAAGAGTASSLMANVPQLPASFSAMFPFGQSTLFNASGQSGTIQVRHPLIENVAFSALRISQFADLQFFTPLPVFRSDSSIAPGDRLLFAGVEKTGTTSTQINLQETGGFAAAFTMEFFDGSGAPVAPGRNGSLLPFGYLSVADAVPVGAQSARVSFTSDGAARLSGYASVVDVVTQDSWIILDSSRIAAERSGFSIVPYPSLAGAPLARFEIYITNGSSEPAAVTVGRRLPARRRGSSRGSAAAPDPDTFTLAPRATRRVTVTSPPLGYVPISGPAGAISASGRLTATAAGRNGAFGAGVPALPLSAAAGVGSRKRFSRVSDAPNVSPPTLFLLETDGKSITARVTIRFSFPAGSAVSGQVTASKDYTVAPGQLLTIPDVTRSILGAQRDSVGTVHNLLVDIEVVSGEGRMLPYLQTNDRSGDITIATD